MILMLENHRNERRVLVRRCTMLKICCGHVLWTTTDVVNVIFVSEDVD